MDANILLQQLNLGITSFIDQLPGYFLIKDNNFKFILATNKTAKLFGFKDCYSMIGKTDYDLKCDAAQCASDFQYQDLVVSKESNKRELDFIGYYSYADEWRITLNSKRIVLNDYEEAIGVSCYAMDVTDYNLIDLSYMLLKSDAKYCPKAYLNQFRYFLNDSYLDEQLTVRQAQCLFFLLRGKSVKMIAKILDLSPRTVESHVEAIKLRLNCQNKSELIEKSWEKGYINVLPKSLLTQEIIAKLKQSF